MKWHGRLMSLMMAGAFLCLGAGSCTSQYSQFRRQPVLCTDADHLTDTWVSPHLQAPIHAGKNIIWCGTFQLAWNELADLVGGKVQFAPPEPDIAAILNRREMTKPDLDDGSYVAAAGYVGDGICRRIDQLMLKTFHGEATLPSINPKNFQPTDIVAYSYLFKNLKFPTPFEKADQPLDFAGTSVDAFGMERGPYKQGHEAMAQEVSILDYRDETDFVIELQTLPAGDHLFLAKVTPGATLAETIAQVRRRIAAGKPSPALPTDILAVPKMDFDITRNYKELIGKTLIPTTARMAAANDTTILDAFQRTRFELDEQGVILQSVAEISVGCSAIDVPVPTHVMVFDKPFLLMMTRTNASSPYFAMWVENAELLVKAQP